MRCGRAASDENKSGSSAFQCKGPASTVRCGPRPGADSLYNAGSAVEHLATELTKTSLPTGYLGAVAIPPTGAPPPSYAAEMRPNVAFPGQVWPNSITFALGGMNSAAPWSADAGPDIGSASAEFAMGSRHRPKVSEAEPSSAKLSRIRHAAGRNPANPPRLGQIWRRGVGRVRPNTAWLRPKLAQVWPGIGQCCQCWSIATEFRAVSLQRFGAAASLLVRFLLLAWHFVVAAEFRDSPNHQSVEPRELGEDGRAHDSFWISHDLDRCPTHARQVARGRWFLKAWAPAERAERGLEDAQKVQQVLQERPGLFSEHLLTML